MIRDIRLWFGLIPATAVVMVVVAVPTFGLLGLLSLFAGFLTVVLVAHKRARAAHKMGLFGQWSQPSVLMKAELDSQDLKWLQIGVMLVVSGVISVCVLGLS